MVWLLEEWNVGPMQRSVSADGHLCVHVSTVKRRGMWVEVCESSKVFTDGKGSLDLLTHMAVYNLSGTRT